MTPELLRRAKTLKLYGLVSHWEDITETIPLEALIEWEETERSHRGFKRRETQSRIERFKPLAEFDWHWPKQCDREAVEELMRLNFIPKATNIILCGPNGVGKTTLAQNLLYYAITQGYTGLFVTASQMLNTLSAQETDRTLNQRIQHYVKPSILVIDEVGYLSYSNRHADLMFEIISRRYEKKPTIVTTNKPFAEWGQIFPNASCVVSLIDRLVHHSEIINIDGESYRLKEAKEQSVKRKSNRRKKEHEEI
jgi:DNA replication protein DnaC